MDEASTIPWASLALSDASGWSATDHMVAVLNLLFPKFNWDDEVLRTGERFIEYLEEYLPREQDFNFTTFKGSSKGIVVVRDIEFSSICKHHLLPFMGKAIVAYIPNKRIVGISKIPRLVQWLCNKPSTQEELGEQIADFMEAQLEPKAVGVVLSAAHTCMGARGIRKVDASLVTSTMRGNFLMVPAAREEFLRVAGA
jgi:GTP cyclohydrolase I